MTTIEYIRPEEIEAKSFALIEAELPHLLDPEQAPIIKRVIHSTADFEFADSLCFSDHVVQLALKAIGEGACVVTDTNMAKAGINKALLAAHGGEAFCFMADDDVRELAKANGTTRAQACMDKAVSLDRPLIFAIGNAPTALLRLHTLMEQGKVSPRLIIGVPVGFVNVVPSKELIMGDAAPYIVARGRKGGSTVAAAIVNALLYLLGRE
ncbi:MAG: precorrin-8X methylmutase [Clostridia bacterium]